jgi:S-(hydroxymethyl)glutathione dehydrogenase/alcohol dehydrogenase
MKVRGAIIRQSPGALEVAEMELEDPRPDEVQVKMVASGMCHSDDHHVTGDSPLDPCPFALGHEGAGIVTKVGPNSKGIEEGDHVVFAAIPACGHCRWCAVGMSNLCDLAAGILAGPRWTDGSYRLRLLDGTPVGQLCGISTFTDHTTASLDSVVKVDKDIPLDKACLIGCAVSTGWGSSVNSANVRPGDTVIIIGVGGLGSAALQGARHSGASNIIAVDPVPFKREQAPIFGATHAAATIEEGADLARSFTNGQGADSAIVTIGVVGADHIAAAFSAVRKGGTAVVTGLGDHNAVGIPISPREITLYQKRLQGSLFGAMNANWDVRRLVDMYRKGNLLLDEMVTRTYTLDQVAQGYEDMHAGKNIRGVVRFD